MSTLRFIWDKRKAAANLKKQAVSFEEARSAFVGEHAKHIDDPDNSESEDRFILLGLSSALRLPLVCDCYRSKDILIGLICARKAKAKKSRAYR